MQLRTDARTAATLQTWDGHREEAEQMAAEGGHAALWGTALVLGALTTGMALAHTLELPQKMRCGPVMWTTVAQGLYRWFARIGGPIEGATLALMVPRLRGGGWAGCTS